MLLNSYLKAAMVAQAVKARLYALRDDESGAGLIEYALLAALIAVASVGAISLMQDQIDVIFGKIETALSAA